MSAVADPDLQIRGGVGVCNNEASVLSGCRSGGSRPSDKGGVGVGHPDPEIREGRALRVPRASLISWIRHWSVKLTLTVSLSCPHGQSAGRPGRDDLKSARLPRENPRNALALIQ